VCLKVMQDLAEGGMIMIVVTRTFMQSIP